MDLSKNIIRNYVKTALLEDAAFHDATTQFLIPANQTCEAVIIAKEDAVLCGLNIAKAVFKMLDKNCSVSSKCKDGDKIKKKSVVLRIKGKTRAILSGERVALNFLGHLSGVAAKTNFFISQIKPFRVKIMDTRKTIPGLRVLEKYAVFCGGGKNHRLSLKNEIFIKDNHKIALNKIPLQKLIEKAKKANKYVIAEVENIKEAQAVIKAKPDVLLLDNMNPDQIKKAVQYIRAHQNIRTEASGSINLNNIRRVAQTGVERISIGALTHSAPSIDFSLELKS